jgi:LacI family transcriptional regulator
MESITSITKEVTIYDIAKQVGLSPATVSRALSNHPAVNKNTRKKVFNRAREMGYRSNTFASNLRRQRTNTIGVIVPHLNSYFVSSALAGMEKVANEAGYTLLISQSLEASAKEIANAQSLFNSRVDGLLVSLAHDTPNIDHFEPYLKKGIPLIFFDRVFPDERCTSIVIDNFKAGYESTTHLLQQGCRRIVHLTANLNRNVYLDRFRGYQLALLENNLPYEEQNLISINLSEEEARQQAARQVLGMDPLPDAVFAANDTAAATCIRAFQAAGLRVPEDIAVVGFNDEPIARFIEPNLTTIHYPGYEMGEIAAINLINHLNGTQNIASTNTIILRAELVIRKSSRVQGPA